MKDATWISRHVKRARAAFKNHTMKVIGPGHWRLKNPKEPCHFWCDIVVMGDCGLAVWGDIEGCFFSYYSNPKRPEEVVYWMADADVSYYGRQKAHIGMSGPELVDEYVDEVAIYDLRQRLKQAKEEHDDEWDEPRSRTDMTSTTVGSEYTEAIESAIESIQHGEHITLVMDELRDALRHVDQDAWEWLGSIGRVPSSRLIYTLSAVRRLGQLLRREEKKRGQRGEKEAGGIESAQQSV